MPALRQDGRGVRRIGVRVGEAANLVFHRDALARLGAGGEVRDALSRFDA